MITGTLLAILAIAYIVLKISNTRAEFARRDAQRLREQQEAEEEEEIRRTAIDVEAETIDNDDLDAEEFVVEPASSPEEGAVVIEVPEEAHEYETV